MQRLITSCIAKSIKNSSSIRRYHARESSCVGKSIKSSSKSIIIGEFQQRGRFRSTSPFLSNYPNKSSNFGLWTTVRSFSSSGAGGDTSLRWFSSIFSTGVDEISKESAVSYVEQLVNTFTHLVDHPVVSTLFWLLLTTYFSPRFLKFMYARLPYDVPYEDTFLSKIERPIHDGATIFAFVYILYINDRSLVTMDSMKSWATLIFGSTAVVSINEEYKLRRNLPFSVGDTVKIRTPIGYLEGKVETTGQDSSIRSTAVGYLVGKVETTGECSLIQRTAREGHFCVPYSSLSSKVIVRSIVKTIQLKIHDVDKISQISEDVISMMRSNPNVSLEMGLPYCNCSQKSSNVKLTLGCDVKNKKSEKYVLRNAVRIIKKHGGELICDTQPNSWSWVIDEGLCIWKRVLRNPLQL